MAHGRKEAGFGGVRLLGGAARQIEGLLLDLPVGDVAHHRHDFGLGRHRRLRGLIQRPATHFDPDELGQTALAGLAAMRPVAPEAEFDATRFAATSGVG